MTGSRAPVSRPSLLALIAGVIVCVAASAVMMPYVPDDSYISFR